MEWKGQAQWLASPETEWQANGEHAGSVKAAGPLSFVKVAGAGHMVSMQLHPPASFLVWCLASRTARG